MNQPLLSERIKIARENIGITKAEAARRLNMSKIGYCRYEYGERTPSLQTLEVIAQCFNTSVSYLLGKCDDISPDYIVIRKNSHPELFEIVQGINSMDSSAQKRLFEYYKITCSKKEV